jgi:hypothetical protein
MKALCGISMILLLALMLGFKLVMGLGLLAVAGKHLLFN